MISQNGIEVDWCYAICIVLILIMLAVNVYIRGVSNERNKAIDSGAGKWTINTVTGEKTFKYIRSIKKMNENEN